MEEELAMEEEHPMELRAQDLATVISERNGSLRAHLFGAENIEIRITAWETGLSLLWSTDSARWHSDITAPSFQLVPPPGVNARAGLSAFLATIPRDVKELVAPFSWRQIEILQLLRRAPQMRDLVRTTPMLVANVLEHCAMVRRPGMPEDILAQRQRGVLRELHGAEGGTDARVRLLQKIRSHDYGLSLCSSVRTLLQRSELPKVLAHVRELPGTWIEVLADASNRTDADLPAVRRLLLSGACTGEQLRELLALCRDSRHLGIHPSEPERSAKIVQARLESCGDLQSVVRLHDRLLADALARLPPPPLPPPPLSFPAPPVRGTKDIVPILSLSELAEEGATMKHCCSVYAERIARGESYLYRVLEPERGTIELQRCIAVDGGADWRIAQLKLTANAQASPATWELARAWLGGDLKTRASANPATR